MSSEETPLLTPAIDDASPEDCTQAELHDAVYARFTPTRKRVIVALVSSAGLLPMFVAGSFVPSIPQIARELDSTGSVINLAISTSIFSGAIGTLTWATYSGFYGRRPIYLVSLPIFTIGSLGVTFARTVPELMSWRVLQAFGAGGGLSVGAGVIGDIYRLEERGTAMGIFFAATLVGPAIAPLTGGLATHYASWRVMQGALFATGLTAFTFMYFLLPETSQPRSRGMDKLLEREGDPDGWRWVLLNPFRPIPLLRSPNILAVCLTGAFALITNYTLLTPLYYTIGQRYGLENEAVVGAFFLPAGLGNLIGAPLAGRISDRVVIRWKTRRGGVWVPEDRLRGAKASALVFVPLSVLTSGIVTHFVSGTLGIVLNLLCLFMNGVSIDLIFTPVAAYNVDIMHSRSAEVMAVTSALRSLITAFATAAFLPLINNIGVLPTDALSATLAWIGFGLLWTTIQYGDRMRAWVDIGYSTAQDN